MRKTHWVAMAGIHGCMCNYVSGHDTYEGAVEALAELHELGKGRRRELKRDGYLELNMRRDGNEYAEVSECDCDRPEDHDD